MYKTLAAVALFVSGACGGVAAAQSVYRCGDSYSQQPCPGGTLVQAEDARSASQRSQTSQAAQRDAKTADALEKARLKEEAKPAAALVIAPPAQVAPDQAERSAMAKPKKPAHFTAVGPRKPGDAKANKKKTKKKTA